MFRLGDRPLWTIPVKACEGERNVAEGVEGVQLHGAPPERLAPIEESGVRAPPLRQLQEVGEPEESVGGCGLRLELDRTLEEPTRLLEVLTGQPVVMV